MRRITLSSVAYMAAPHFSSLFKKGMIFGKKNTVGQEMCVLIFSTSIV